MKLRVLARLLEIQGVLMKHGLDEFVPRTHLSGRLRFAFALSRLAFRRRRSGSRGESLRLALQELGPIFVKFGQAVSTRRDLLPFDIAEELAKLQDRVPPFDGKVARRIIEGVYGKPVTEVFAEFDEQSLAAASIAQVHAAKLHNGKEVVVKVLRPGMREEIERDLEVLYALADLAQTRCAHQRHGVAARGRRGYSEACEERRGDFLHAGVPPQFLPRGHAPGQHLRAHRRSREPALRGHRLRNRRHAGSPRPALSRRELPCRVRSGLPARGRVARGVGLGAAEHSRG
jgi:hypothetical protein